MENNTLMKVEDKTKDEEFPEDFQCCVCLDLLYKPIVLVCGHISCFWCIHKGMNVVHESNCPICQHPYSHFPSICQLLHFILLKLYPVAYKRRERQIGEEEKEDGCFSPKFDYPLSGSHLIEGSPTNIPATSSSSSEATRNSLEHSVIGNSLEHGTQKQISVTDFLCAACKKLLFRPVVLNCGHVYCESCIIPMEVRPLCLVCQSMHPSGFPSVCLILEHLIEKKFPQSYAQRRGISVNQANLVGSAHLRKTTMAQAKIDVQKPMAMVKDLAQRIDQLEVAFRKTQSKDYLLYSLGYDAPIVQLPPNFNMKNIESFNGTGDPKHHIRHYKCIMRLKGLDKDQMLHAFPLSLTGLANTWYYSADPGKVNTWENLVVEFIVQFSYNTQIEFTLKDLEATKQSEDKLLFSFRLDEPMVLPPYFNMECIERFDGTGDPKHHIRQYKSIMQLKGLDKDQMLYAFPLSLTWAAARWYYLADPGKFKAWENLVDEFVKQFSCNIQIDFTLRDLKAIKQRNHETFSEFFFRWRENARKMVTSSPPERDLVKMIMKNLIPPYRTLMLPLPIFTFKELRLSGSRIEDALNEGNGEDPWQ